MSSIPVPLAHLAGGSSASWALDALLIAGVAAAGIAYDVGVRRLHGRTGRVTPAAKWRALCFAGGLAALLVALVSPLDALSVEVLSAHMGQHLILIVVAAPLLVLGAPAVPILLALPVRWRRRVHRLGAVPALRRIRRAFTQPLVVWLLQVVALWTWHVPALYDAAVRNDGLHALEHASFLGTAFLFWWVLLDPAGRRRLAPGHDILYVFTAGAQSAALGALLTFASSPLYRIYVERAPLHGVSPLQDQQLAGLVMWIPAGVVYLVAAAVLFVRWLRSVEEESRRQERTTAARRMVITKMAALIAVAGGAAAFAMFTPSHASPALTPQVQVDPGRSLYLQDCAWCHGVQGEGTDLGPTLRGVGAASADFMLTTGRMPIPRQIENPPRRPAQYSPAQIADLARHVASFAPGPPIPRVNPAAGDLRLGLTLYQDNCAACHGATGTGGALTQGLLAPGVLHSTPRQIAEAMRLGGAGLFSGNMPKFSPETFDEHDVDSIITYIQRLPREDRGGLGLRGLGPVAEGFVAWAVGLLALIVVIRWIGERE